VTAASPAILAFTMTAPQVSSATRHRIEPAVRAAAERRGGVVIRTCHRIEWYHDADGDTLEMLTAQGAVVPHGAQVLEGFEAVDRLVSVALGLESAVLGEDQILHQVRLAVAGARARGRFGGDLALAFDVALHAGRLGRTWRPARSMSIGDIAVQRAEALSGGHLAGRRVLVVGGGEMGRLAAGAARARGAQVALASRDRERAREAAVRLGIESWPFDPGEALATPAVVIIALAGPWTLAPASLRALADGPVVIDLSMPAALPESVATGLGTRHLGIDDLAVAAHDVEGKPSAQYAATRRYRERLLRLHERTLASYRERIAARRSAAIARDLAEKVERERIDVLESLFRGQPHLASADQAAIDAMTVRLTDRLFRSALERLASDGDDRGGRAVRDVFGL
jgi:glutamyl-tRNA reductase